MNPSLSSSCCVREGIRTRPVVPVMDVLLGNAVLYGERVVHLSPASLLSKSVYAKVSCDEQ